MPMQLLKELVDLRRNILTMGAAVEQRIHWAMRALLEGDMEAAQLVRKGDNEIDRMEIINEEECLRILALTHPVAGDLRFVLSAMRINTNLERIADMARSVAKRAIDLHQLRTVEMPPSLATMATETEHMFVSAMKALADEDADLAQRIRKDDQRVDDLQKEVFAWAQVEIPRHVEATEAAIDVLSIARKLERIADVCTNIAEDVIFMSKGSLVRHEHL
ncbi:MAG: phosphate signaling complex protein PhoU [Phycisphaeraceae bacterium]|nr:phosphate signaling complex protein PhoU [Phycisphaerales bacterium]QOJ17024.1 MAG: phosphate signaling complex protein PhoU [Phycisphaeraceae bacterium]